MTITTWKFQCPELFNYLRSCTNIQPISIEPNPMNIDQLMLVSITMRPKRPLQTTAGDFQLESTSKAVELIVMESQINGEKHERL